MKSKKNEGIVANAVDDFLVGKKKHDSDPTQVALHWKRGRDEFGKTVSPW
jgi:hypothetical protein